MTLGVRSRIAWFALIGVMLVAAQALVGAHFHFSDDTHHDQTPALECSICLVAASVDDGDGPLPVSAALEVYGVHAEDQSVPTETLILRSPKYAGSSPRGPPVAGSCAV